MPTDSQFPPPDAAAPPSAKASAPARARYGEEAITRICNAIRLHGLSEEAAALVAGASGPLVHQWKQRHPALAERLERARAEFHQARLEKIREACGRDGAVDWRAQAYLLEKAHTAGSPGREQSKTTGDEPISPLLVISPEQLILMQKRRLAALAQLNP